MQILLVDDCKETGILVKQCLYPLEITQTLSVAEARKILEDKVFDLVLIDIMLPDGNGFIFCNEVSKHPNYLATPLILLTSKDELADKVYGLNCGACDYVTKPFSMPELKARINAHLRQKMLITDTSYKSKYFELDANLQKCFLNRKDGRKEHQKDSLLTPTEFRILMSLYKNKGITLSRQELIRNVWKNHGLSIEQKGLDTHIAHLRKKLSKAGTKAASQIVSIYGVGYLFDERD